jgi:hypothetical protein
MRKGLVFSQPTALMNGSMEGMDKKTKNYQPKVPQSGVSSNPKLTQVSSDRMNRTGPEPSWGGEKNTRAEKETWEWV